MGLENELFLPKRFGAISLPAYGLSSYPSVRLPVPVSSLALPVGLPPLPCGFLPPTCFARASAIFTGRHSILTLDSILT
jgi:hypothetical protein